jgi:hypothetical protein
MIYRENERFYVTKSPLFAELKKKFPEIEKGEPVYMEVLRKDSREVETDKGTREIVWPERYTNLTFSTIEDGEKTIYRYQETIPTKDSFGQMKFKKEMAFLTTRTNPSKVFITDLNSPNCNIELLYLLYFFSPLVQGGKMCTMPDKAVWRFVNKEADAQSIVERETRVAQAISSISASDIDRLASLFEFTNGERLTSAQMNLTALKGQYISLVKGDEGMLNKVLDFFNGAKPTSDVEEIVDQAIEAGVLFQSEDGNDVVLKLKKGDKVLLEGVSIEDKATIALFLAKNGSAKGSVKQQLNSVTV